MTEHLHHVHLFARDLEATLAWWRDMLGAEIAFDGEFGGARNVLVRVGSGRLHLYDQPPRDDGHGAVHHIGIRTDDLDALEARLRAAGVAFRSGIRDFGAWKYIMCPRPTACCSSCSRPPPTSCRATRPPTSPTGSATEPDRIPT